MHYTTKLCATYKAKKKKNQWSFSFQRASNSLPSLPEKKSSNRSYYCIVEVREHTEQSIAAVAAAVAAAAAALKGRETQTHTPTHARRQKGGFSMQISP